MPPDHNDAAGARAHAHLYRPVLLAAALLIGGLLFQQLATLLVALLFTVILAIPAAALATRLERLRVPRAVGAFVGLAAIVGTFVAVLALVTQPVVEQAEQFIDDLPQTVDVAVERVADLTGVKPARVGDELQSFVEGYVERPQRLLGPLTSIGATLLAVLATIVFVLITAFYMAMRPDPLVKGALELFPPERRDHAAGVMERLRRAWIGWLKGVAIDMLVSGLLLYIGLSLADVEFALLFAVLSAVLVVVPYFGAIVGGIPPVMFALTDSPDKALLVLAIYIAVQQIEGNLIVPLVMARTVNLHPAVIAVGVVVVGALFGIVGLLVSVPLISMVVILTDELWIKPRERRARSRIELTADPNLDPPDAEELRAFAERDLERLPQADVHPDSERHDGGGERQDDESVPPEEADAGERALDWEGRRFLLLLGLPAFALALSITMVTTYLPLLLAEYSGPAVTGLLIGTEGLLALFIPLLVGTRSDETRTRFGRRMPYLLLATPVAAVALVLMPVVGSLAALVVLLLVFYASYFTYYSPYFALYPDLVPHWARGRSQSFQSTLREIGLGGALVGGGVLLGLWRPLPFLVAALLLIGVTLAFAWRLEEPDAGDETPDRHDGGKLARLRALVREHSALRWLGLAIALWELTLAALKTFVVLFFTAGLGYSMGTTSAVLAVVAVGVLVGAVVGGKLADRMGHVRLVGIALWVYGIGAAVPAFWHPLAAIALVAVVSVAAGIVMTLSFSMMMAVMPDEGHGAASGLYGFARGTGVLLGPILGGLAITLLQPLFESTEGYAAVFLVAAAGILASIPVFRVAVRTQ